jgi:two-component system, sensor histidine kinase
VTNDGSTGFGEHPGGHLGGRLGEEVRAAYDYLPATIAGNLAGVGVVALLFAPIMSGLVIGAWLAAFATMLGLRAALGLRFRQRWQWVRAHPGALPMPWARWRLGWNIGTLCSGLMWGSTAWIFFGHGDGNQQTALVITVYTFCIAAVPVLATQPRIYLTFAALCFVPLIARLVMDGTRHSLELAGILLLIFTLTSVLARSFRDTLRRAFDLKVRADELLVQLRAEREAADAARRDAETANRAKTQFLAAASHDLRQPLHAMGLFAEALRERTHDAPTLSLVNSINASVDALEGLFSELLDISRLDAGGVQPQPVDFALGELFRKLALHHQPDAFEKGLDLRFRGGARVVRADPVLVERIVRNLLSNAIRYTDDGSVLVSARRRNGRIDLQVWDTGVGIAPAEQARVFDEFYQVKDGRSRAAHEKKGLGLGLAIVQRMAALIEAPLSLRSMPGRGTVFTLNLPAGRRPEVRAAPTPSATGAVLALGGRRVVVVEDDPAVLGGLQVLLAGWGASVQAFASHAQAVEWLERPDPPPDAPDLLIVDYRLEGDRDGIDLVGRLRRRFGAALPAIVVSGSTLGRLEELAVAQDVQLLIKPVVPARLRAVVNYKLSSRPAAARVMPAGTPA